jgi:flagellar biosynthesis/type III secretory pathway ATPase
LSLGVAFFEFSWALAVGPAVCGELIDSFMSPVPFEMAPKPTSAREALSNIKNRPIKRRRLEKAN